MLTLFVMLTLENLPEQIALGGRLPGWTILYFVGYALVAAFLVLNIPIGVVISSLEEHARERADRPERADPDEPASEERIAGVREALDRLAADVRRGRV